MGESYLYVSLGTGTSEPMQLKAPPELVYLRLRSPKVKESVQRTQR